MRSLALKASGAPLEGGIELHFTYDEEVGRRDRARNGCSRTGLSRPDFAISAGFAYGITTAHNGCLHLEVEVLGKSGHAAEPHKGVDALEAANGILSRALRAAPQLRGGSAPPFPASCHRRSSSGSSRAASTPTWCRTT